MLGKKNRWQSTADVAVNERRFYIPQLQRNVHFGKKSIWPSPEVESMKNAEPLVCFTKSNRKQRIAMEISCQIPLCKASSNQSLLLYSRCGSGTVLMIADCLFI